MNETTNQSSWNYKRIFVVLLLLFALGVGGYYISTNVLGNRINPFKKDKEPSPMPPAAVKGVSSEEKIDIKKTIEGKIEDIKKDVGSLNVSDIASSSPQVQKILSDIKSLQEYPANELKNICKQICGL